METVTLHITDKNAVDAEALKLINNKQIVSCVGCAEHNIGIVVIADPDTPLDAHCIMESLRDLAKLVVQNSIVIPKGN